MKVGIVVFPGSNCDRDMHHVLRDVFELDVQYMWHTKQVPADTDALVLPGGFSYGDRLRAGAIAAHSPVMTDVRRMASQGVPILGVCNGFQILVESGILPGALLVNESLEFMCQWTSLVVENTSTPFTSLMRPRQRIPIPIANGEGRYYADEDTIRDLNKHNRIIFRYAEDVNGSDDSIAGICNERGNVVGMMPHPERAAEPDTNPVDCVPARLIFESMIRNAGADDRRTACGGDNDDYDKVTAMAATDAVTKRGNTGGGCAAP